ncbi:hypothetical protein AAG587_17065 [Vreelandella neptunia]|jgi:hypothetical protein|uniref:hypothetical protein n=1 Tax=Vreelandella neptunia TaxID=115551 RepID=UPI003159F690
MVGPATAQDSTIEEAQRENLRVIQVRHRDTPNSESPDAILMIQRIEQTIAHGVRLTLRVKRIDSQRPHGSNEFCWAACYSQAGFGNAERVKLTDKECRSGGDVRMRLSGLLGNRIGTYLMTEIVAWAKQWPTAEVMQIKLSWEDEKPGAWDGMNVQRRNRFYEQFGIEFIPSETESSITARSKYMLANDLTTDDAERAWSLNIQEMNASDWLVEQQRQLEEQEGQLTKTKRMVANRQTTIDRIEAHPYRYAACRLLTNPLAWGCLAVAAVAFSLAKEVVN